MELNEIAIQSALLSRHGGRIIHAFCTRRGGVSEGCYASLNFSHKEGDAPQNVEANKAIIAAHFPITAASFLMVQQTHGADILVVEEKQSPYESALAYDGLLTALPGVALCIKTADCVPILLFEPQAQVVGAIHAGWRGTALNIVGRAVEMMVGKYAVKRRAIIAAIGPAIGACCYEVDDTVRHQIQDSRACHKVYYPNCFLPSRRPDRWLFNIKMANRQQLLEAGLTADNLEISPMCTACEAKLFFSHRRDKGKTGRMLNFIALQE